ncbi:MAG: DUF4145 domain-containing protein [Bacteroidetes bacterium]|nr:DUF4145 domain-containing protein [Bacteroidota bacterium]
MTFNWTCPYCDKKTTINRDNFSATENAMTIDNSEGYRLIRNEWIVCPNEECKKITLTAVLHSYKYNNALNRWEKPDRLKHWRLLPGSFAKVFPDYIPVAIKNDYEEASAILELSPKASATLSRRCLQGIIRDFWRVSKARLVDEINAIEEKVDPLTWKSIDSVRKVGNIGAHMEKDINLIIDVEPKEAQLLLELIELLFEEWYIHRHERELKLKAIVGLAEKKEEQKKK